MLSFWGYVWWFWGFGGGPWGPWMGKLPLPNVDEFVIWWKMWLVWVFVVAWHLFNKKDYKNTFSSFSTNNMDRKPNCEVFLHDRNGKNGLFLGQKLYSLNASSLPQEKEFFISLLFSLLVTRSKFTTVRWGGSGQWWWIGMLGSSQERHFVSVSLLALALCPDSPPLSQSTPSDSISVSALWGWGRMGGWDILSMLWTRRFRFSVVMINAILR